MIFASYLRGTTSWSEWKNLSASGKIPGIYTLKTISTSDYFHSNWSVIRSRSRCTFYSESTSYAMKKVFCLPDIIKDLNPAHKYWGIEL